jgi:hypothetical protein
LRGTTFAQRAQWMRAAAGLLEAELPSGGVKNSGYGRALSAAGIREFCNLEAVRVGESTPSGVDSATE